MIIIYFKILKNRMSKAWEVFPCSFLCQSNWCNSSSHFLVFLWLILQQTLHPWILI